MKLKYFFLYFILLIIIGCKSVKTSSNDSTVEWYRKDFYEDKVPGISYEIWLHKNKIKKKEIIVATLDCQIDLKHVNLINKIWVNKKEIPNNNIDDDKNGYVDDINGWSFLGTKSNNYVVWENYEFVRLIRKWDSLFKGKNKNEIKTEELNDYKEYLRAVNKLKSERLIYDNWLKSLIYATDFFPKSKDTLKYFFPKEDYTYKQLDSLYKKHKINDKSFKQRRLDKDTDLGALIDFMMVRFENDERTLNKVIEMRGQVDSIYNKSLNIDYDERVFLDDKPYSLSKGYGTNNVSANIVGIRQYQGHNTMVSSIIAGEKVNKIGVDGFSNNIKIMPINVSASGDEHDKDIAMGIYYAVDNGAKIINMSFSKGFSVNKEWVFDALKYAEEHNVLVVHCSGNDSRNIDLEPLYPNDTNYISTNEVVNNFICVGSTTQKLDSTFVSSFSNYGKINVDLFAPGSDIKVCIPNNKYDISSGTSFSAPMVSGTAALIWLYFPKLTVQQVKNIILESGTTYDIDVLVPGGEGKKAKFSELSKSGKVLNVYNAMKMAEEVSKRKK